MWKIYAKLLVVIMTVIIGEYPAAAIQKQSKPPDMPRNSFLNITVVYRVGGRGEFQTFADGAILHSGDHYKIILTPKEDCYVYIFQIDSTHTLYQLFPMERFGEVVVNNFNPVSAGKTCYIPSESKSFVLDERLGAEKIYFVLSRERDLNLEEQYGQLVEAQQRKRQVVQSMKQIDELLEDVTRSKNAILFEPKVYELERVTWQEEGQRFSVLQQRLENTCDGCAYVLQFEHQ